MIHSYLEKLLGRGGKLKCYRQVKMLQTDEVGCRGAFAPKNI